MPIVPNFDLGDIKKKVEGAEKNALLLKLRYVGEECIRDARLRGSYTDRTGNLRSSISYVIFADGKVNQRSTPEIVKEGTDGATIGMEYAEQLAQETPGIGIVVVAGMNYAMYVQRRGYNVLASAELLADKLVTQLKLQAEVKHING